MTVSIYKKNLMINLRQAYNWTYDNLKTTNELSYDNNCDMKT